MAASDTSTGGGRLRILPVLLRRAPWWVLALAGMACVLLGLFLLVRPLSALSTLAVYLGLGFIISGIGDLLSPGTSSPVWIKPLLAGLWVAGGVAVLLAIGTAVDLLAPFVAISLLVSGVLRGFSAISGGKDARIAAFISAVADLVLGMVALSWPDVTLLVVAVLFGARTVFFGLARLWEAVLVLRTGRRGRHDGGRVPGSARPPGRFGRFVRVVGAVAALALATGAAVLGLRLSAAAPELDPFYAAPDRVPGRPGAVVKSEPFTQGIPEGATAWRTLYTTRAQDGAATLSSGLVVLPTAPSPGPRPVVAWAHGTTGYEPACAPSNLPDPFTAGAMPALADAVANGWALVATDYPGLGTAGSQPYLVGKGEGYAVLDSIRAAKEFLAGRGGTGPAVVWGHSQGGHAALWAGGLAAEYAPELGISGVAALAPASDPIALVENLPNVKGGSVFASFVAAAYAGAYPDVKINDYVDPTARTVFREMSTRCLAEPGVLVSVLAALSLENDRSIFRTDPGTGTLGSRLAGNTPTGHIGAPLLLAQGGSDPLVTPAVQDAYVKARRAGGQGVDYRLYPGLDHMGLVAGESPLLGDLVSWTQDRIAGAAG
ncbi:lipase family protein [Pseudarthrobacter sp. P1]|uniref:lipase family protein n=1 Tax=Pseudarthrobacter sp. P1 TaxID=3418418 RepID=UPI003CEE3F1F